MALAFMVLIYTPKIALCGDNGNGGEVGNGGDQWSVEFVAMANLIKDAIEHTETDKRFGIDPTALDLVIKTTKVESTPDCLYLHGVQKTAINYPSQKRILLSRPEWDKLNNLVTKRQIVLHEYLGIMRIDDQNYQISSKILSIGFLRNNPCDNQEQELEKVGVALFNKRGDPITKDNFDVWNPATTSDGRSIIVMRGYAIPEDADNHVSALMVMAECNPRTGKYEILATSGSGAGIKAAFPGTSERYKVDKKE